MVVNDISGTQYTSVEDLSPLYRAYEYDAELTIGAEISFIPSSGQKLPGLELTISSVSGKIVSVLDLDWIKNIFG